MINYFFLYRAFLEEQKIEVVPHYMVASKEPVKERTPANYVKKKVPEVTTSYHEFMVKVREREGKEKRNDYYLECHG